METLTIRNISEEMAEIIEEHKKNYGIKTNTAAIESIIIAYVALKESYEELRKENVLTEKEIHSYKKLISDLRFSASVISSLWNGKIENDEI